MVKTPKKPVPGGDERSAMYVRRIKPTNQAENTTKKHRESDSSNRIKSVKVQKKKLKDDQPSASKEDTAGENMHPESEVEEIQPIAEEVEKPITEPIADDPIVLTAEPKNGDIQEVSNDTTENYSVDIVESTTSDISEIPTKTLLHNETANKLNDDGSSFALKDVQIKLNDCLKDNNKQSNDNSERNTPEPVSKDISFGQSLRSISGRNSLGRMRHDCRFSPNNSLYVNTSNLSSRQEEFDYKILYNGTPNERKRKIDDDRYIVKKQKFQTDNGLMNNSSSIFKGLRTPIQISTAPRYEFSSDTLDKENDQGHGKKWCIVM